MNKKGHRPFLLGCVLLASAWAATPARCEQTVNFSLVSIKGVMSFDAGSAALLQYQSYLFPIPSRHILAQDVVAPNATEEIAIPPGTIESNSGDCYQLALKLFGLGSNAVLHIYGAANPAAENPVPVPKSALSAQNNWIMTEIKSCQILPY